jgi:hypothetical protein
MRRGAALVIAVLLLGACGGGDHGPTLEADELPSTTTTPRPATPTELVFLGQAGDGRTDRLDVWGARLDGSDRHVITRGVSAGPNNLHAELSPDGTRLAYRHQDGRIYVRRLDAGGRDIAVSRQPGFYPMWLDDKTVLHAPEASTTTWIAAADGSSDREFTSGRPWCVAHDRRVIVQGPETYQAVDENGVRESVTEEEVQRLCAKLAPDGQHIARPYHATRRHPHAAVAISRPDGTEQRIVDGCDTYLGRIPTVWSAADVLFMECTELGIERMTPNGQPELVLPYGGGFWRFLGVRVTR